MEVSVQVVSPEFRHALTLPWFSTEAERDRRYTEWTASGGVMASGMECRVGHDGRVRVWRDGVWS